jgi:hypothetical protein
VSFDTPKLSPSRVTAVARIGGVNAPVKSALGAAILTLTAVALAGCSLLTGVPEGETDVFSVKVGDCINLSSSTEDEISSIPVVPCDEPHDQEVFDRFEIEGDTFPGDSSIEEQRIAYCEGDAFTSFVGIPWADSMYATSGLTPTSSSWDQGDREVLCTIGDPNGQTTGSLKGINQ